MIILKVLCGVLCQASCFSLSLICVFTSTSPFHWYLRQVLVYGWLEHSFTSGSCVDASYSAFNLKITSHFPSPMQKAYHLYSARTPPQMVVFSLSRQKSSYNIMVVLTRAANRGSHASKTEITSYCAKRRNLQIILDISVRPHITRKDGSAKLQTVKKPFFMINLLSVSAPRAWKILDSGY